MDLLRERKQDQKIVIATLEVMACLIKDDEKYCGKNANVLETSLKITEILENNSSSMDVIMPSLAILLAMRDKNLEGTMKSLVFLKS